MALIRMELLKLIKRPMTWVLFILLHGGIGFGIVVGFLNIQGVEAELRLSMLRNLTLPGIIPWAAQLISVFGAIMLAILAASAIGSEYGWGTLRPLLATGMPRAQFLAAKLAALALIAFGFLALALLMCIPLAIPIALLHDRPAFAVTVDLAWLLDLAAIVGRTYLTMLIPMTIAFLVGLVGRSQAAGIGAALGLLIGEQVVTALLLTTGLDWAEWLVRRLPDQNSQFLISVYNEFGPIIPPPDAIGEWQAIITLIIYGIACVAVAFLFFGRRDIRGAA